ncbi:MAG: hypothetical protein KAI66_17705 [Lentisphaeria bacterium]|nr:hypothetical protein [Lentisphaeria bacterium]
MPLSESPMGLALVVCDTIIEDKTTGKKTLVGLFDRVQTLKLPCAHPAMSILVTLTGGRGDYPAEVICRHTETDEVTFSAKGKVTLRDPRQVVDLVFRLNGVRFKHAGMHWVQFLADDMPIMMRPLFISLREKGKDGKDEKKDEPGHIGN